MDEIVFQGKGDDGSNATRSGIIETSSSSTTNSLNIGYWMASVVRCFPAPFFFLLVFLLGTFPSPPLLLHPPAHLLAKPFLKPILNAISPTNNLLLWLYFLIIPFMGWNSSRFYPFSLYTVRLSHTIPQLQQVSWGETSPLTLPHQTCLLTASWYSATWLTCT